MEELNKQLNKLYKINYSLLSLQELKNVLQDLKELDKKILHQGLKEIENVNQKENENFRVFLRNTSEGKEYDKLINTLTIRRPKYRKNTDSPIRLEFTCENQPVEIVLKPHEEEENMWAFRIRFGTSFENYFRNNFGLFYDPIKDELISWKKGIDLLPDLSCDHAVYKFLEWLWSNNYLAYCKVLREEFTWESYQWDNYDEPKNQCWIFNPNSDVKCLPRNNEWLKTKGCFV